MLRKSFFLIKFCDEYADINPFIYLIAVYLIEHKAVEHFGKLIYLMKFDLFAEWFLWGSIIIKGSFVCTFSIFLINRGFLRYLKTIQIRQIQYLVHIFANLYPDITHKFNREKIVLNMNLFVESNSHQKIV